MVATTECDRSKASSNKVSKPLMEKKRRARINQCLDQLKSLLENHYSTTIRKRKLEKADILELTVRHLRHLQKMQKFSSVAPDAEYHTGFRSCVSNVNHYLLTADRVSGADRWALSQLSSRLGARGPEEGSSTTDSASHAHSQGTRRLVPSSAPGSEGPNTASCKAHSPEAHGLSRRGQTCSGAQNNTQTAKCTIHCELLNDPLNVWRPW